MEPQHCFHQLPTAPALTEPLRMRAAPLHAERAGQSVHSMISLATAVQEASARHRSTAALAHTSASSPTTMQAYNPFHQRQPLNTADSSYPHQTAAPGLAPVVSHLAVIRATVPHSQEMFPLSSPLLMTAHSSMYVCKTNTALLDTQSSVTLPFYQESQTNELMQNTAQDKDNTYPY